MSTDDPDIGSRLTRTLADFVRDVGFAVAEGQQELDSNSLKTQSAIDRDAAEGRIPHRFEVPWYRFAEVDVDMRIHFDTVYERDRGEDNTVFYTPRVAVKPPDPRRATVDEHVEATSGVRFRLVPVPPDLPSGPSGRAPDDDAEDDEEDGE
jgi:hypothetical protein